RLLITRGTPGETYCVCSGEDIAISELAESLLGLAATPMTLVTDPDRQRPVDLPVLRGDNAKLLAVTGWERRHRLTDTLSDILAECRQKARANHSSQSSSKATADQTSRSTS